MMSNYDTEIVIYQSEDGQTKVDVRFEDETVWLSQKQLVELFQSSKANISEHIKSIYDEGELDEASTVRKIRTVQNEGFGTDQCVQQRLSDSVAAFSGGLCRIVL